MRSTSIFRCKSLIVLILSFAVLVVVACSTVPLTGRSQLMLVSRPQLLSLAQQSYQDVLKKQELATDEYQLASLRRVGRRIAGAYERFRQHNNLPPEELDWEFNLIKDDEQVNAWVMPGGKVAFYTGILPYTADETGMATVMGHEVAHVMANHAGERMSQALAAQLGGVALAVSMHDQPERTQRTYLQLYGIGAQVGVLLPYSRLHETEADRIGLTLMALAGYDPREAIPFWQRMQQANDGKRPPTFLSTHPAPQERIARLRELMPDAVEVYRRNQERW